MCTFLRRTKEDEKDEIRIREELKSINEQLKKMKKAVRCYWSLSKNVHNIFSLHRSSQVHGKQLNQQHLPTPTTNLYFPRSNQKMQEPQFQMTLQLWLSTSPKEKLSWRLALQILSSPKIMHLLLQLQTPIPLPPILPPLSLLKAKLQCRESLLYKAPDCMWLASNQWAKLSWPK